MRALPVWLPAAALLCGAACAPSTFVSSRVRLQSVGAGAEVAAPQGERWWQVILHAHSVMNLVWVYRDVKEAVALEDADRRARHQSVLSRMQHYRPDRVAELLERAARRGADALVLTEHNTLSHARDPLLPERRGRTRLFKWATEWTSWAKGGHALLLGVGRELRPVNVRAANASDFRNAVAAARSEGAVTVVCHPTTPKSPWKEAGLPEVDAVEVINSWPFDGRGSEGLWQDALRQGRQLGAVAGADWHATAAAPLVGDWRVTEVRAPVLEERAIYEAIARGRTVARNVREKQKTTVRLLVEGRCREGDTCAVDGTETGVVVEVRDGYGLTLEVFDEASPSTAEPALRLPVERGNFRVVFRRPTPGRGFVRAVLRGIETVAVGSPVYLRRGPVAAR